MPSILDKNEVVAAVRDMLSILKEAVPSANKLPASPLEPPTMPELPHWKWLSPLERSIVDAVRAGPLSAEEIARVLGESASSRLRTILANLVERDILAVTRDGYSIDRTPTDS